MELFPPWQENLLLHNLFALGGSIKDDPAACQVPSL